MALTCHQVFVILKKLTILASYNRIGIALLILDTPSVHEY